MLHPIATSYRFAFLATLFASTFTCSTVSAECNVGQIAYHLPAQRLDERLQELAHRSGCFITVDGNELQGKTTPPLVGSYLPQAALVASVQGTGLETEVTPAGLAVNRNQQLAFDRRIAKDRELLRESARTKRIDAHRAAGLGEALRRTRMDLQRSVERQGFLSAAEKATFTSSLEQIEREIKSKG